MRYALGDDRVETDGDDVWIAPTAVVIGKVKLAKKTSIWWHAVLRGDNEPIIIGEGTNIQDSTVIHTDPGFPVAIGERVTVGHMAMIHGCSIGDGALIGINAVVLNGAKVGKNCLIGAKALVTEGMEIPDNSLAVGAPAKVIREVTPENIERMQHGADVYIDRARLYREQLRED
jgi:carbonic anhydrase/acetyltransferase-like protein (isoleucine patch superfamily)